MNDFVEAIKNSSSGSEKDEEDPSSERYDELKKKQADVERGTPAEKRYQELKEKAKQEMIEKEHRPDEVKEKEDTESEDEEEFITH